MGSPVQRMVRAWERGARASHEERLRLLARLANRSSVDVAQLTVGECHATLLEWRARHFGEHLELTASCPGCGEGMEFEPAARAFALHPLPADREGVTLQEEGWTIVARPARLADVLGVAALPAEERAASLLARCVLDARHGEEPRSTESIPELLVARLAERLADADPSADVTLAMRCEACGHVWRDGVDVCAVVWADVAREANRALVDVDRIARAYGWEERTILSLSPARRALYLELVD